MLRLYAIVNLLRCRVANILYTRLPLFEYKVKPYILGNARIYPTPFLKVESYHNLINLTTSEVANVKTFVGIYAAYGASVLCLRCCFDRKASIKIVSCTSTETRNIRVTSYKTHVFRLYYSLSLYCAKFKANSLVLMSLIVLLVDTSANGKRLTFL